MTQGTEEAGLSPQDLLPESFRCCEGIIRGRWHHVPGTGRLFLLQLTRRPSRVSSEDADLRCRLVGRVGWIHQGQPGQFRRVVAPSQADRHLGLHRSPVVDKPRGHQVRLPLGEIAGRRLVTGPVQDQTDGAVVVVFDDEDNRAGEVGVVENWCRHE